MSICVFCCVELNLAQLQSRIPFINFLLPFSSVIKARFAHLCTVMSRMHHRREGYPFGSLVDFAPDSMGRKSIILHFLD